MRLSIESALGSFVRSLPIASLAFSGTAIAQAPAATSDEQKRVRIIRVDAAPTIDGRLDEEVWSLAAIVEDFHQVEPVEYAPPSEHTLVYLAHDADALYVAARLLDSRADEISAQVLRQGDQQLWNDDRFGVILDPFNDRRSGYLFEVNVNGVRRDALYQNTNRQQFNWEGIWQARSSQDEDGWAVEMRIPFKTLSFDPDSDEWGINFQRFIIRLDETVGWVSRNRSMNPGVAGRVTGFNDLQQGMGLDVVPSIRVSEETRFGPSSSDVHWEPSLDVFKKLTPSLNAALTINTDFSATEVDDRQVNLTRFNLFFPEKRDFFLQDADIFEFGRLGGQQSGRPGATTISRTSQQNGRPFFSRRIGLGPSGQPVDLNYGGKLSGRVGRWSLGALGIGQDGFRGVDPTTVLVGRAAANVLSESTVGVIVTSGDPRSNLDNTLVGMDFRYLNTRLARGRNIEAEAWVQQTETEGRDGNDGAYGLGFRMPNNTGLRGGLAVKRLEENFRPALGFVSRTGIQDRTLEFGHTWRRSAASTVRDVYAGVDAQRIEFIAGGLQTEAVTFRAFEASFRSRDSASAHYASTREVLTREFEISDGVVVPRGDYRFDERQIMLTAAGHRTLSGSFRYRWGNFYDGKRANMRGQLDWKPSIHFRANIGYEINDVDLPHGDFVTRQVRAKIDWVFSSKLSWVNLVQYDTVSETVGLNSRLHWIPQAGREGFIVLNHHFEDFDLDDRFHSQRSDLAVKFNYTFRF